MSLRWIYNWFQKSKGIVIIPSFELPLQDLLYRSHTNKKLKKKKEPCENPTLTDKLFLVLYMMQIKLKQGNFDIFQLKGARTYSIQLNPRKTTLLSFNTCVGPFSGYSIDFANLQNSVFNSDNIL